MYIGISLGGIFGFIRNVMPSEGLIEIKTREGIKISQILRSKHLFQNMATLIAWGGVGIHHIFESESQSMIKINHPYQRYFISAKFFYFSIFQHWENRFRIYRKGLLPKRLVQFLNKMTRYHLLESDGSVWRFKHQVIQDHFSRLWNK